MTALMLSAGKASRLNGECKAMAMVGQYRMHQWWRRNLLERVVIVCRSEHEYAIPDNVRTIVCDDGGGSAVALNAALEHVDDTPLTVIYGDTWAPAAPGADEFCGVAAAGGGRSWDVVEDGLVAYRHVEIGDAALVCVGLYRFVDITRLAGAIAKAIAHAPAGAEVGMADVVNNYRLPFVPVVGWQDVGDFEARARWRQL